MKALSNPNWQIRDQRNRRLRTALIGSALCLPVLAGAIYLVFMFASTFGAVPAGGKDIFVRSGGNFQAALVSAQPGDTILLQAGSVFTGNFELPKKSGDAFITIRTSVSDGQLPGRDERIVPQKYASALPKLVSPNSNPVVNAAPGAHHYRFVGVEFGGTKDGFFNIVQIGNDEATELSELPHHIEFDRVYMHATSPLGQRRGIAANGRSIVIKNSHISGIRRKGEESQAIAVWATDGPVDIINNYLEAAAENILFGGAGSTLKLVPSNCVIRGNTLSKPLKWREEGWLVKNLFEIKNGRNIVVKDNLMLNNWGGGQDGTAVLFTTREDNGPATVIEDIVFENNIVRGAGGAVSIYGSEGSGGRRLTIRNNLFADIDKQKWSGSGQFLKISDWKDLKIENNTVINSGNITTAYGRPVLQFVFRNNIVFNNAYGLIGDDASPGSETLNRYFPGAAFSNNIIVGGSKKLYGSQNFYVDSLKQIGLIEADRYELSPTSPFRTRGFGGGPIGFISGEARIAE